MSKLSQIVNIIFVRFNVQTQVFSCQLIQFFQVHIVAQIISFESYNVLFTMFIKFLKNPLELFRSLENIGVVRVDIIGFFCVTVDYRGCIFYGATSIR